MVDSARVWDEAMDLVETRHANGSTTQPANATEESLIEQLSGLMDNGPGAEYGPSVQAYTEYSYGPSVQDASFQELLLKSCVSQVAILAPNLACIFCVLLPCQAWPNSWACRALLSQVDETEKMFGLYVKKEWEQLKTFVSQELTSVHDEIRR